VTTELASTEFLLLGEYLGLCSCEPLITFSLIGQYIILLFVCFLFKDALTCVVDSLTLNGQFRAKSYGNSWLKEAHRTRFFSVRHIPRLLVLRNTKQHLSTVLGGHFRQQNHHEKAQKCEKHGIK